YYEKTLEIDQLVGNDEYVILDKVNIATVQQKIGNYDQSLAIYLECLEYYEEVKDSSGMASINFNIGNNFAYQMEYERAVKHYQYSLEIAQETGNDFITANCLEGLGKTAVFSREFKKA